MKSGKNPEYQYSKQATLNAAINLLQRQGLIYQATSPGGPLPLDRRFLSSFSAHNFLLAAMIIYLNIMNEVKDSHGANTTDIQRGLEALEMSRDNWLSALSLSREAHKASRILVTMVGKVHSARGKSPTFSDNHGAISQQDCYNRSDHTGERCNLFPKYTLITTSQASQLIWFHNYVTPAKRVKRCLPATFPKVRCSTLTQCSPRIIALERKTVTSTICWISRPILIGKLSTLKFDRKHLLYKISGQALILILTTR